MVRAMRQPSAAQPSDDRRPRRAHGPRRVTEASLRKAALRYIDHYSTSVENLRRVLGRKVARSVRDHGTDAAPAADWITRIVADLVKRGLVDDEAYAAGRARALRSRGASHRAMRAALRQKGVDRQVAERALAPFNSPEGDRAAACRYARRRRLGPYRAAAERAGRRDRDVAALTRAGFGLDLAFWVIDAASVETLEEAAQP